jgi:hypothetical protein
MLRAAVALIILAIGACALLSAHQHTPFPLLVDEAEATAIVCNPTIPRDIKQERFKGVQKT